MNNDNLTTRTDDRIARALKLPRGAEFHRCTLQVNPYSYGSQFRGQSSVPDLETHAKAIVEKAVEIGVSVLAITNHNDASGVAPFREAAEDSKRESRITIFPGFELTSSEGIHILCIYPPDTVEDALGRFLGEFGIRDLVPSSKLSDQPFHLIPAKVRDQGGITIAAHVTTDHGLFRVLDGQSRIKAWHTTDLLAIQIPKQVSDLHPSDRMIVENKNPDYCRDLPVDEELAIAVVNARDIVKPHDLDDPSATCWIKMSEISVEGL